MTIKSDSQLKTAIDFLIFVKVHNATKALTEENEALRGQIETLEQDLRVSQDLLAIGRSI